ncbi:MAG: toxin-antitoxin system TumE family protein [Ardenticatenaceae bacterium]
MTTKSKEHQLIFRYDSARHRPPLSSPDHKHLPDQIIEVVALTLAEVLEEITTIQGWL